MRETEAEAVAFVVSTGIGLESAGTGCAMTRVADRKTSLQAETSACYRGRKLAVTIQPHAVVMREMVPGHRTTAYTVPWLLVYELGMKLAADEARRAKGAR